MENVASHISDVIAEKKVNLDLQSKKIWTKLRDNGILNEKDFLKKIFSDEELFSKNQGVYFYENDKLLFWNNSEIILPDSLLCEIESRNDVLHLENGWFLASCSQYDTNKLLLLDLICTDYPLENDFLSSRFHADFGLTAAGFNIRLNPENAYPVKDSSGQIMFYIGLSQKRFMQRISLLSLIEFFVLLLLISFLYILIFKVFDRLDYFKKRTNLKIFAIAFNILFVQLLIRVFGGSIFNFQSELFQPALFSSGYIFE